MADAKLSALTEVTTLAGDEYVYVVDDPAGTPVDRRVTVTNLLADRALASGEHAVNTVAASGATETLTLVPSHKVTMDQNCTFTFPTPTLTGWEFRLSLSGAFTPTFPASVDWDSATPPTYASPSTYVFSTDDGGTNWLGSLVASAAG